jgi:hypothetical protein
MLSSTSGTGGRRDAPVAGRVACRRGRRTIGGLPAIVVGEDGRLLDVISGEPIPF